MSYDNESLKLKIRLSFGTSQFEPTNQQLEDIKREFRSIIALKTHCTEKELGEIVKKVCPSAGTCGYFGANHSDLITLLKLATNTGR